jgi:hypothetical protein
MCLAIDFNGKPTFKAHKIDYDIAQRMLTTKFITAGTLAQFAPNENLGQITRATLTLRNSISVR